jgi:signal transduction histidine kinase
MLQLIKNPNTRILGIVVLGYMLICVYFTIWTYYRQYDLSERSSLLRLEGIANAIALQIDGDTHAHLTEKYPKMDDIKFNAQDTLYKQIHHILRRNYAAQMLKSPTYTMILDTTKQQFEFIATSSDSPYYRHIYDTYNPILKEKYTEGGVLPMYMDKFGMWLSAFAPVRNAKGQTVAVVMTDEKFDQFVAVARKNALSNLVVALLIILPFIALLFFALRHYVLREARLKKRLEETLEANVEISHQLEESYEKLSSIDTLRKEMIANISHDLRTPLTNLSGYIETLYLRRHSITMEERERYLTIGIKESERLKKLIDDLFELSKLEANQVTMKPEPFPIAELLQDIVAKYEVICQEKKIKMTSNLSENTPWVVADIKLIDRVFQNLLDNALKYNLTGNGTVHIDLQNINNQLLVKIENTGDTIPPSVLPHIFNRYFKKEGIENSTGLGLAIVKKILDLHQSDISVTSADDVITFEFRLPIYGK